MRDGSPLPVGQGRREPGPDVGGGARHRGLVAGVVVTAALLVALPASAYTLTGAYWTWQDHPIEDPFTIAAYDFPSDAGDTGEITDAFTGAMDSWNALGLDVALRDGGLTTSAALDYDGHSIIQYGSYSGIGSALAFAGTWTYDDGAAFDCDVYVLSANDYGTIYWDADPAGPADGRYDLQSVALHELGHCLGLDHSADSSAVMYAYYGGIRTLTTDDVDGASALYDTACADSDGDGAYACDFDCDDTNALVYPGATEVCDGVDGDCDGVVDASATETATLGDSGRESSSSWLGAGNAFQVDAPTALVSARAYYLVDEGSRLVWSVYVSTDSGATWDRVRTEITYATADTWQESPALHQPLTVGAWYIVALGAYADTTTVKVDLTPDLSSTGLVTPLGAVNGRAMADDATTIDDTRLYHQELELVSTADADGDGVTPLCGDPCPDDDANDADGDGACADVDPCPDDAEDDADRDGACADVDPCPDDPLDDADGDGACADVDPCPDDARDDADGDGTCADADPCPEDPADTCDDPVDTAPEDTDPADTGPGDTDPEDTDPSDTEPTDTDPSDTGAEDSDPKDTPPPESPGGCGCTSAPSTGLSLFVWVGLVVALRRRQG